MERIASVNQLFFRQAFRPVLFLEKMFSGIDQAFLRNHPDNFRPGHARGHVSWPIASQASNAAWSGVSSIFVRFIETCAIPHPPHTSQSLSHVSAFLERRIGWPFPSTIGFPVAVPSSVFTRPVFSNVEGNGICSSHRFGVEVYIVSDQEFARPNYSRA